MDLLAYEKKYWQKGLVNIVGIDEAGRGPLAGPVVAACVVLHKNSTIKGVNDSKKLSPKKRDELFDIIVEKAADVSVGIANEDDIDKLNILQATFLAMKRAVGNLKVTPDQLLVDGPYSNIKMYSVETIIKGDSKSASVASASIIAKVTRDRIMEEYHNIYPEYNFIKHKGYGTKFHIEQLLKYKATPIHRKSFKIVKSNLPSFKFYQENNGLYDLGRKLVATYFIKKNYRLYEKDVFLKKIGDYIDYIYTNKKDTNYIKVVVEYNSILYPLALEGKVDTKSYIKNLRDLTNEKDVTKKTSFIVILVKFITRKKPLIKILNNENIF